MMTPGQLTARLPARLHGPHSDDHTDAAAGLAAEAARFLNYATGPHAGAGLGYPAPACAVTGALSTAAGGLGQLTAQLAAFLARELAAGRLGDDHGRDPAEVTARAASYLDAAARHAAGLHAALSSAQSDLGRLHQASQGRQVAA
jgi:hypothetical protein